MKASVDWPLGSGLKRVSDLLGIKIRGTRAVPLQMLAVEACLDSA